jgi:hypothetical protein
MTTSNYDHLLVRILYSSSEHTLLCLRLPKADIPLPPGSRTVPASASNIPTDRNKSKSSQSYVTTDSLGVRAPPKTYDQFLFSFLLFFNFLYTFACLFMWGPSLMRGWVCSLQLLLRLTVQSVFRSHRTHDHILLSQIWDFPNLERQVPVFTSPRKRVAQLYSHATINWPCLQYLRTDCSETLILLQCNCSHGNMIVCRAVT